MTIRCYWPTGPAPGNMGDVLTPWLIKTLSGETPEHCTPGEAGTHLMIGSILKHARPGVHVWGTGAMRATDTYHPEAVYHAVRGPLSRDYILRDGGACPEVYGDPAVLLPRFHNSPIAKTHRLGILPHYVDYEAAGAAWSHLPETRVIDVLRANPLDVVDEIRGCECLVTSSLHGLIVAHSYGIPAAWIGCVGDRQLTGDGTKFRDWFLSSGVLAEQQPWRVTGRESRADLLAMCEGFEVAIDREALLAACPIPRKQPAARPPLVISFYTADYAVAAWKLQADCERLGLDCAIRPAPDRGAWIDNTRYKGEFVHQMLREHDRPVLWIDADGSLREFPSLLVGDAGGVDFAGRPKPADHARPWYVGTLWFNNTPGGKAFAKAWAERCASAEDGKSDEWAITEAWPAVENEIRVLRLPEEYCTWPTERDAHIQQPVILHGLSGNASKFNARLAGQQEATP